MVMVCSCVYCVLSVLILIHYNYYNCAKRPHGIGSTTGVFSLELSVFVRLLQPTSVSNFPSHVISRATSQCWSQIKLACQSLLQWCDWSMGNGKQILLERGRAGAGTELKSIPLPHQQLQYFETKIMFSFYNFTVCQQYEEFRVHWDWDSELNWVIYNKDLLVEIELSSLVRLISSTVSQCLLCHSNWRSELLYFSAWNLNLRKASERN